MSETTAGPPSGAAQPPAAPHADPTQPPAGLHVTDAEREEWLAGVERPRQCGCESCTAAPDDIDWDHVDAQAEVRRLAESLDAARADLERVAAERDQALAERDRLAGRVETLESIRDADTEELERQRSLAGQARAERDAVAHLLAHLDNPGVDLELTWPQVATALRRVLAERDRLAAEQTAMQARLAELAVLRDRVAELEQALHEAANLAATTPVDEHAIAIDNLGEIVRRAQQAIRDRWRVSASEQVSADGKERCGRMWLIDLGPHRFCRGTLRYHFCGGRALHPEQCHCVECGAPFQERRTDPEPRPVTDWGPPPESPSTEER